MKTQRRFSKQRETIYHALKGTKIHPTADQLYSMIKSENPEIGIATVYRNLKLLVETGKIKKIQTPLSIERYDADLSEHYHLVCGLCGCVSDVFMEYRKNLDEEAQKLIGAQITGHEVVFSGICKECLQKENGK